MVNMVNINIIAASMNVGFFPVVLVKFLFIHSDTQKLGISAIYALFLIWLLTSFHMLSNFVDFPPN